MTTQHSRDHLFADSAHFLVIEFLHERLENKKEIKVRDSVDDGGDNSFDRECETSQYTKYGTDEHVNCQKFYSVRIAL